PRERQARRMRSWRVLQALVGKLALQQAAQQFGHGHALAKGGDLDARAERGRHVERQACGVEVALVERTGIALANPRLGVRIRGRTCADANALAARAAHVGHRSSSSASAAISRVATLSGAVSRASRPAATLSAKTMR